MNYSDYKMPQIKRAISIELPFSLFIHLSPEIESIEGSKTEKSANEVPTFWLKNVLLIEALFIFFLEIKCKQLSLTK